MKKFIAAVLMLFAITAFADDAKKAPAPDANVKEIKSNLTAKFPNFNITEVKPAEIKGLYEITVPGDVVYSDGKYLMVGHIYNFDGEDLTQMKIDAMIAKLAMLVDKSKALKIGNGKKEVLEFSDPECPYCIKAESFFTNADVTRYVFFTPLSFHKDAHRLSVDILCADNPEQEYYKVLDAVKQGNSGTYQAKQCDAGEKKLMKMIEVGEQFGVRGTPFFVIDGKAISGADPAILQMIK